LLKWPQHIKSAHHILTTLKLSKKPSELATEAKKPVRRVDPALRDRTKAPPKPVIKVDDSQAVSKKKKIDAHGRGSDKSAVGERNSVASANPAPSRQRNHRWDGTPKATDNRPVEDKVEKPAPSDTRTSPKLNLDTRVSPKPNKEEPHYRQAPRRGGKVRDGFDANAPAPKPANKATSNNDLPRLSKVMAERGLCSRREADDWIEQGWVMVDGEIVDTLGTRIQPDAEIIISDYAREEQAENVTIILNKPIGYVSGQAEDGYEPAVVLIQPENQWSEDGSGIKFSRRHLKNLAPSGRLDIDSTGMLVLTQDGRIARHLIGEDSTVEKEYLVRVEGELSEAGLKKLNHGLSLDGVLLKSAKVSWQNEDQLRFVLREGRKRQIRRMCELVGLHVVGLKRIRIGSVTLGQLPAGQWRYLRQNERF
jgi:23S rRNA pseudouridine2604 synthase